MAADNYGKTYATELNIRPQHSPLIVPSSSISIASAAGCLGNPGMVMIDPVYTTRNPAPAETLIPVTVMVNPLGHPGTFGLSVKEAGVLPMQTGREPKPSVSNLVISLRAAVVNSTPMAP